MFIVYSGVERDQQQVSLTITRSCYVSQSPILTKTSPTWTLVREVEVAVVVEVEVVVAGQTVLTRACLAPVVVTPALQEEAMAAAVKEAAVKAAAQVWPLGAAGAVPVCVRVPAAPAGAVCSPGGAGA